MELSKIKPSKVYDNNEMTFNGILDHIIKSKFNGFIRITTRNTNEGHILFKEGKGIAASYSRYLKNFVLDEEYFKEDAIRKIEFDAYNKAYIIEIFELHPAQIDYALEFNTKYVLEKDFLSSNQKKSDHQKEQKEQKLRREVDMKNVVKEVPYHSDIPLEPSIHEKSVKQINVGNENLNSENIHTNFDVEIGDLVESNSFNGYFEASESSDIPTEENFRINIQNDQLNSESSIIKNKKNILDISDVSNNENSEDLKEDRVDYSFAENEEDEEILETPRASTANIQKIVDAIHDAEKEKRASNKENTVKSNFNHSTFNSISKKENENSLKTLDFSKGSLRTSENFNKSTDFKDKEEALEKLKTATDNLQESIKNVKESQIPTTPEENPEQSTHHNKRNQSGAQDDRNMTELTNLLKSLTEDEMGRLESDITNRIGKSIIGMPEIDQKELNMSLDRKNGLRGDVVIVAEYTNKGFLNWMDMSSKNNMAHLEKIIVNNAQMEIKRAFGDFDEVLDYFDISVQII